MRGFLYREGANHARFSMRWVEVLVVFVTVVGASTAPAIGNEPPLADAGLDQQVEQGETVLLDAAGSRDPDGTIVETTWRVEAPNGTTFDPRCSNCTRAEFTATRLGTYNVSLAVTDDAGASRTDWLHVTVVRNPEPRVTLDGPTSVLVDDSGSYRARMAVPNGTLARAVWRVDGNRMDQRELSGERDADTLRVPHRSVGRDRVRVVVHDVEGRTASATRYVRVRAPRPLPSSGSDRVPDRSTPTGPDRTPSTVPTPPDPESETPRSDSQQPSQPRTVPIDERGDPSAQFTIQTATRDRWLTPTPSSGPALVVTGRPTTVAAHAAMRHRAGATSVTTANARVVRDIEINPGDAVSKASNVTEDVFG